MASDQKHEIVLYDLACAKGECFSPMVWRTRLMLNYKRIPYRTQFIEFQDVDSTLKSLPLTPHEVKQYGYLDYTVPAIHVPSSDTWIMDSAPISKFLEDKYPDPPLPLGSELGTEIEERAMAQLRKLFRSAMMVREVNILEPEAAAYFRRTREASIGCTLEELSSPEREEAGWEEVDSEMRAVGELIMKSRGDGPFLMGKQVSYPDFVITAFLQCARVIDEGVFQRICKWPGWGEIYEACESYMDKKD